MQRDGVRQNRADADRRHFVRGHLHLSANSSGTLAKFTAGSNLEHDLVPMLANAAVRKIEGQQLYITGSECRGDGEGTPQAWWVTVLTPQL